VVEVLLCLLVLERKEFERDEVSGREKEISGFEKESEGRRKGGHDALTEEETIDRVAMQVRLQRTTKEKMETRKTTEEENRTTSSRRWLLPLQLDGVQLTEYP
jgi:hypothetical protein